MTANYKEALDFDPPPDGAWTVDELPQEFPPDYPQDPPVAQRLLEGDDFHRVVAKDKVRRGKQTVTFTGKRSVKIMAGNGGLGHEFQTLDELPVTIIPGDYLALPLGEARVSRSGGTVYDRAFDGHRSLETVKRHGASKKKTKLPSKSGVIPGYQLVPPATSFKTKIGTEIEAAKRAENALLYSNN